MQFMLIKTSSGFTRYYNQPDSWGVHLYRATMFPTLEAAQDLLKDILKDYYHATEKINRIDDSLYTVYGTTYAVIPVKLGCTRKDKKLGELHEAK